jgi:hypothetical protein
LLPPHGVVAPIFPLHVRRLLRLSRERHFNATNTARDAQTGWREVHPATWLPSLIHILPVDQNTNFKAS